MIDRVTISQWALNVKFVRPEARTVDVLYLMAFDGEYFLRDVPMGVTTLDTASRRLLRLTKEQPDATYRQIHYLVSRIGAGLRRNFTEYNLGHYEH